MEQPVPAADVEVNRQAEEFKKATGIDITVEMINQNDMAPDYGRGRESQRPRRDPDERQPTASVRRAGRPQRLRGGAAGRPGVLQWASGAAIVDGVARGVPLFNLGNAIVYRKDVFEELDLRVPNTWDEYLEVGRTSRRTTTSRSARRSATPSAMRLRSAIRCCGASVARRSDETGKTAMIDPEGTYAALAFTKEFWEAVVIPAASPGTTPATIALSWVRPSARP